MKVKALLLSMMGVGIGFQNTNRQGQHAPLKLELGRGGGEFLRVEHIMGAP